MIGVFEFDYKFFIKTRVSAEIHAKLIECGKVGDVCLCVIFGVQFEGETIVIEIVIIDLEQCEIQDDSFMCGKVGKIFIHV